MQQVELQFTRGKLMMLRVFFVLFLVFISSPAHAYFDPGSGVVILQVLIAAVIGVVYRLRAFISVWWDVVVKFFRR